MTDRAQVRLRETLVSFVMMLRAAVLSLRDNWSIAVLAVALAVTLWIFVTDKNDPERTARVSSLIPVECVNVPLGKADAPPCSETKTVTVRVRAPESVLEQLTAEDFLATADLSEMTTNQATVPVFVDSIEPRAEIIEISPAQITVRLEDVTSRSVPVQTRLVGVPPRGYEPGEMTLEPEEAVVTGPESLVARVVAVEADINLTNLRSGFEQTLLLQARDEAGANIQGVNVEPESVNVQGEITQLEISTTVVVRPDVQGNPADGFSVNAIQVDPPFVVVRGPAEVIQSIDLINGVSTAAVSIADASADVVRPVVLQLPEGAAVEQPRVTVRVLIAPTVGSLTYSVPLATVNRADGLAAELSNNVVLVTLRGTLPDLAAIDSTDIQATVDVGGLSAGTHLLPIDIEPPPGATVASLIPIETTVTLSAP